jgi:ankyrin repeat protein
MRRAASALFLAASLMAIEPSSKMVEAVKKGDISTLKTVVNSKEEANAALANGKTILMLCVWDGKMEIVKYLLEQGANINAKDASGKTPLMLAVWRENLEIAKLLVEKGADKNAKNSEGLGLSEIAQLTGNGEIIDYINSITK